MGVSTIVDVRELPVCLTMAHAQRTLGVSRKTAYDLAHRDDFPVIRPGRTIRVPREAFLLWLARQVGVAEG